MVPLIPEGEDTPINTSHARSDASKTAGIRKRHLPFSNISPAANGGHSRRWSHKNRHVKTRPWTPLSSRSDHPETDQMTLIHQTLTHSSSLKNHCSLKGHGNEADFLGFLQKLGPHRSLTLPFEPFRFWL
jgi:hypothetical protein